MNACDSQLFQLQDIRKRELSEEETSIVNIWANATAAATQESAAEVAHQIDRMCPSIDDVEKARDFTWMLWDIMLSVAASPDVTSEIQQSIVSVVLELQKIDRGAIFIEGFGEQRMWKDMPAFGVALEAHRTDPTIQEEEPLTEQLAQGWFNFNEFEARLLEAGSAGAYLDAILVLQLALEEELPTAAGDLLTDCRVQAATVWLLRCGKQLYEWALENVDPEIQPFEESYFEAGSLYSGRPFMCPERWGFWLHRLEELGKPEHRLGPLTCETVLQAAQVMRAAQGDVSNA
ncbi:hypothetical protein N0V93_002151 [Gnomoniopsis smithogilvyi]|uniref:Uncharacterized protein n=1 Tax=Gnomoniopsis smithogilvyi TaxID=1191159 RepID=A0A9W8YY37_9PEZI|nr:hypothetical protein N0V93_002151 [Gnomoniopsis smithogilvyi]